ncbi:cell division protein ZapA [Pseudoroseomonas cervicalis]|uniref:cell division protein ZapA n=1 Tax=Teichococcus cervicalis TaxID=204525 RepID=UPI0027892D99|nr:cell division protein ZapA [Pseudoroseomonas cervicalis]MDQ1078814.1 cell division protein ZapA [Pseudoroseomonas cervicalis]
MGQVTVRVGGYTHPVSCEDGQEGHLIALAAEVDRRVSSIRAMGGQFGESRLLLLAALLLADEIHDLRVELSRAKSAPAGSGPAADPALADRLSRLAEKIEGIAATLDAS